MSIKIIIYLTIIKGENMANFLELEIVKYLENENSEIVGIEWENVCINVDNISHYKKINNTLRRTTDIKENALLFINDKGKSASLDAALSKSQNGDAFLKEDFNHFLKNNVDMSGLIFDGKAHPSLDAIELYFKAGVNPLGKEYEGKPIISSCGRFALEGITLKS